MSAPTSPTKKPHQRLGQTAAASEGSIGAAEPPAQQNSPQQDKASQSPAPENTTSNAGTEAGLEQPGRASSPVNEGREGNGLVPEGQAKEGAARGEPNREGDAGADSDDMFLMDEASPALSSKYFPL